MSRTHVLAAMLLCLSMAARAEVTDLNASGFVSKHETTVNASAGEAYKAFVGIAQWWNPAHTYSGDAANLTIDARPGGCFCERLPDGGGVQHLAVVYVAPGKALRLVGGLGPLQGSGVAGSMTWSFTPAASGTRIGLSYSVGGYFQGGFDKIAPAVDGVLGEQITRLKALIETGKPAASK